MNKKIILSVIATIVFALPSITNASTMYFSTDTASTSVGDIVVIHANLDTQDKNINAIEGLVVLSGIENATLRDISVAGSGFTLWPEKPSFTLRNGSISFSGGVPGGVNGKDINVFDLVLEITNTNKFSISGNTVVVYMDDGSGTAEKVNVETASISSMRRTGYVPYNQSQAILEGDKIAPKDFDIEFGKDTDAYEGKIFITFNTQDKESGIDHFEVKEGNRSFVRTGSPYVLQDQNPKAYIVVRAIDKAGNVREVAVNEFPITYVALGLVLFAIMIITYIFFSTFKKNNEI